MQFPTDVIDQVQEAIASSTDATGAVAEVIFNDKDPAVARTLSREFCEMITSRYVAMGTDTAFALKDGFKVCSFSERGDSTLMWAHYANYHSGFCIEYDIGSFQFKSAIALSMYPVIYRDEPFDATDYLLRHPTRNRLHLNMAALIKSTDWSYEREWRLIFSNGILARPGPVKMPKPKAVYLGSHIGKDHETEVVHICKGKKIPVYKMQHSLDSFVMKPCAIDASTSAR
ncbi:hypothetical protein A9R05_40130 (plasmid) [Burkholderia sp. KK1]|nr:hypothetical protein A9R05_40130 [Burkholderia sp. KK1]